HTTCPATLAHSCDSSLPVDLTYQPGQPRPWAPQPTAIRRRIIATTGGSASVPASVLSPSQIPPLGVLPLTPNHPELYRFHLIAVGTPLAGGPPRRSQRALLTHWAPALGVSAKAHIGKGMHNTGGREPSNRKAVHPRPADPRTLAATL